MLVVRIWWVVRLGLSRVVVVVHSKSWAGNLWSSRLAVVVVMVEWLSLSEPPIQRPHDDDSITGR